MSAFLGPIHTWLYHKIQFQNEYTMIICEYAKENGFTEEEFHILDTRYGKLTDGELADIIDETNIHGWLQTQVHIVEDRLAYLVTTLQNKKPDCMKEIKDLAYQYGKKNAIEEGTSLKEAFKYLDDLLLNGMPCDHVNVIVEESEEHIIWKQTTDIHQQYWDMMDGDIRNYDAIRESLITGILENSGIHYRRTGEQTFEICES